MMEHHLYEVPSDVKVTNGIPEEGDIASSSVDTSMASPPKSIWSFDFYKQFFNVDTDEVVSRITWSMIPSPSTNYLQRYIQDRADLYGPFWICVTLVFSISISGNLANYFETAAGRQYHWKYEFHAVTSAATLLFLYGWILPVIVWAALHWHGQAEVRYRLLEYICVYGYCLAILIPISVLWIIPLAWLQWALTILGSACSGFVLVKSLYPAFHKTGYPILALLFVLHGLTAASFMLYFFHVPTSSAVAAVVPTMAPSPITPNSSHLTKM